MGDGCEVLKVRGREEGDERAYCLASSLRSSRMSYMSTS